MVFVFRAVFLLSCVFSLFLLVFFGCLTIFDKNMSMLGGERRRHDKRNYYLFSSNRLFFGRLTISSSSNDGTRIEFMNILIVFRILKRRLFEMAKMLQQLTIFLSWIITQETVYRCFQSKGRSMKIGWICIVFFLCKFRKWLWIFSWIINENISMSSPLELQGEVHVIRFFPSRSFSEKKSFSFLICFPFGKNTVFLPEDSDFTLSSHRRQAISWVSRPINMTFSWTCSEKRCQKKRPR